MEIFSALLAICAGNSPVTGEFPAQRPVTRSLMFYLICAGINSWVNNREAGDLRRHRTHYDVTVMRYIHMHFLERGILVEISVEFQGFRNPVDNESTLDQIMIRHGTVGKLLPELRMTQFIDAYICATGIDALTLSGVHAACKSLTLLAFNSLVPETSGCDFIFLW